MALELSTNQWSLEVTLFYYKVKFLYFISGDRLNIHKGLLLHKGLFMHKSQMLKVNEKKNTD